MYSNRICVCLLLLSAALGQADIYYWHDPSQVVNRLKPAGFSVGYNLTHLTHPISQLNPDTDRLLIFNSRENATELAVQVSNFVHAGGRVVWVANNSSNVANDLNNILGQRLGVMFDFTGSASGVKLTYEGKDFFPLWDGLFLGTSKSSWYRIFLQLDSSMAVPLSTRQFGDSMLVSSAYSQVGRGEIVFICIPYHNTGSGSSYKIHSFFSDTDLERAENQKAFEEVLAWLSGQSRLDVRTRAGVRPPVRGGNREDLISRLVRSEGIDPSSEKGMALAGKIRELLKSARD